MQNRNIVLLVEFGLSQECEKFATTPSDSGRQSVYDIPNGYVRYLHRSSDTISIKYQATGHNSFATPAVLVTPHRDTQVEESRAHVLLMDGQVRSADRVAYNGTVQHA